MAARGDARGDRAKHVRHRSRDRTRGGWCTFPRSLQAGGGRTAAQPRRRSRCQPGRARLARLGKQARTRCAASATGCTLMALKATISKAELQVSDMDRHYYQAHTLTLAQHPSETEERMMIRLLAFGLNASEQLAFGRGISTDDEPDLWA